MPAASSAARAFDKVLHKTISARVELGTFRELNAEHPAVIVDSEEAASTGGGKPVGGRGCYGGSLLRSNPLRSSSLSIIGDRLLVIGDWLLMIECRQRIAA